jgi:hypothetical protein
MCNFSEFFATGTTASILQVGIYNSIMNYSRLSIVIGFTSSFDEESPVRRCSIHLAVFYIDKHSKKKATRTTDNKYIHNHIPTIITTLLVIS